MRLEASDTRHKNIEHRSDTEVARWTGQNSIRVHASLLKWTVDRGYWVRYETTARSTVATFNTYATTTNLRVTGCCLLFVI
jgi:hypothetical protein